MPQNQNPKTKTTADRSTANQKPSNSTAKPGFKLTTLGWIPLEWEVYTFGDISKVNQGLQIPIKDRLIEWVEGAKIYITVQYLNGGKEVQYVKDPNLSVCCTEEDILMTRTGNTGLVVTGANGAFHNNFFKIKLDEIKAQRQYIVAFLKSSQTQHKILVQAGTSTIPDLNHGDFYALKIPLPPLKEQTRIANCLSTWDRAITTTRKLLQQLEERKKGLMQGLLTGAVRVPGFSSAAASGGEGEWEEFRLLTVADIKKR
jgi:type I restriction enzyme S subunit